jgi:hypothetical protein
MQSKAFLNVLCILFLLAVSNSVVGLIFSSFSSLVLLVHQAVVFSKNFCNGNPLVDERTGARHADVRLGGLWNRHGLKKDARGLWPRWFYSKLNRNKPNKTDRKIYLHGKYISPTRVKFAS